MRLSRKSDYALRAVQYCSRLPEGKHGSINAIAKSEEIPREFLAKILNDLTQRGILVSYRGIMGGYSLARDPKDISYLDVIKAIDGPLHICICTELEGHGGENGPDCGMCGFWKSLEKNITDALSRKRFARARKPRK